MGFDEILKQLKQLFPDDKIKDDVLKLIEGANYEIHFDDETIRVDKNIAIQILYRNYIDDQSQSFLAPVQVGVAIREPNKSQKGDLVSTIFFVLVHYDEVGDLITIDVEKNRVRSRSSGQST